MRFKRLFPFQKHRSFYFDRLILHKKLVKCKQSADGCNWEGTINDYIDEVSLIQNFTKSQFKK